MLIWSDRMQLKPDVLIFEPGQTEPRIQKDSFSLHEGYELRGGHQKVSDDILRHAVSEIRRIVPWSGIAIGAHFFINGEEWSGCAFTERQMIALASARGDAFFLSSAYHEAWHMLEDSLSPDFIDDFDRILAPSPFDHLEYFGSPSERRARVFEVWAMCLAEGLPMPFTQRGDTIHDVFRAAFYGELPVQKDYLLSRKTDPVAPPRESRPSFVQKVRAKFGRLIYA